MSPIKFSPLLAERAARAPSADAAIRHRIRAVTRGDVVFHAQVASIEASQNAHADGATEVAAHSVAETHADAATLVERHDRLGIHGAANCHALRLMVSDLQEHTEERVSVQARCAAAHVKQRALEDAAYHIIFRELDATEKSAEQHDTKAKP